MKVKEIMTADPIYCTRTTNLSEVARMMVTHDCGGIPVVDSNESRKLVGMLTDRDIVCRTLAHGRDPLTLMAGDIMTSPVATAFVDMNVDECARVMEKNRIRRVPVIDRQGQCCGIVAQADVATHAPEETTAEVVKEVSQPTLTASAMP